MPALKRLDRLLERAISLMEDASAAVLPSGDPFRGVYISQAEADRLLAREAGSPTFNGYGSAAETSLADPLDKTSRLGRLAQAFELTSFDLDLVVIALAPEIDLRYERLYGYVQDDVTRRRPSLDLALNLLCSTAAARLARRAHVAADAPLIRHGLMLLSPDPNHVHPPLLAHYLRLDEHVVGFLLGQDGLDARLVPFCQAVAPASQLATPPLDAETGRALTALVVEARTVHQALRLYFHGPRGAAKDQTAEALAAQAGAPLLRVDLARVPPAASDAEPLLRLAFRHARLQDAILYLDAMETLESDGRAVTFRWLLDAVADHPGIVILAGLHAPGPLEATAGRDPLTVTPVDFPIPDAAGRRACWQARLADSGHALAGHDLETLAGRFRLTPGQIAAAAASAQEQARWRVAAQSADDAASEDRSLAPVQPTIAELFAAARLHSAHNLGTLARKITPHYSWDDIVLPDDRLEQLREICNYVKYRALVYDDWGFDRRLAMGKGLNVLFAGPSGTGKTMAADVMASELALDLYKIDLATVVSKYIGETEKNLARIFAEAESSNAILFFDEADALFGRRSEVRDSHDRYANIEISYLLQRMEEYEGVVILATNLRKNMDEAFVRRIHFSVDFPFPSEPDRRRIWGEIWPAALPRHADLDLDFMAHHFELAGGNIRNIALATAFLAADDGAVVGMAHLIHATRREYQKMGKVIAEGAFDHRGVVGRP